MQQLKSISNLLIRKSTFPSLLNLTFRNHILIGISSFAFLFSIQGIGQERAKLEQNRFEIIKEIDATTALLNKATKNHQSALSDLNIIENQITKRKSLINQINEELGLIDKELKAIEERTAEAQGELDSLIVQYNMLLRAVYRNKLTTNPLLNLLSFQSYSQAFIRQNYYNRLQQFLAKKHTEIAEQQKKLQKETESSIQERELKSEMLSNLELLADAMSKEELKQKTLIKTLQENEQSLKANLETQKENREKMNLAIENLINSNFGEDAKIISAEELERFEKSKNLIPWPVNSRSISMKYGRQKHPTIRNLDINNNGIDIRTESNAAVSVVFDGKVVNVSELSGYGIMIIVDHFSYYTVYSKLKSSNVKIGDQLFAGQQIGIVDNKNNFSELHFEIWKNNKTLNPIEWLK